MTPGYWYCWRCGWRGEPGHELPDHCEPHTCPECLKPTAEYLAEKLTPQEWFQKMRSIVNQANG